MQKTCVNCSVNFEVTEEDLKLLRQFSPVFAGKRYEIPAPTHCPDCRQQRRLAFCNELNLYPGVCGLCQKRVLTEYPPGAGLPYYCYSCWHSDRWDPRNFCQEVDFNRPIFPQLSEVKRRTPSQATLIDGLIVNSDYIHYAGSSKNSYLIMHADFCEDCYYGYGFKNNKFCVDGFYNLHCEWCYDCVDVHRSYGLIGSQDCTNCSSSAFLRDCIGCRDCFLCVGLRQKQYCFKNQQLTREAYEAEKAKMDLGSYRIYQQCRTEFATMSARHTFKEYHGHNLQNCVGDYLVNCKDCFQCFDCEDVENARYCSQMVLGSKNIMDCYQYGTNLHESYECAICGANSYHILFNFNAAMTCSELLYCWYMESCHNCFGCANMHRQKYCILNKQYTREEYEALVPRIIDHMRSTGEWGEFLPIKISLFGYNKTLAQLYYPLSREEVLTHGWKWDDYENPPPENIKTIPVGRLPDHIKDIPDDVLSWAITCEATSRPFKITPQELKFYREQGLPLPRRHPHQRHLDRFHLRNPRKFWNRQCGECQKPITTTWSPEQPKKVLCETCYEKVIY